MTALTLRYLNPTSLRVDCSPLTPDRLAGLSPQAVGQLEMQVGRQRRQVHELFAITGTDTQELVLCDTTDKLDHIGHGMTTGAIRVEGDAGAYCGQFMAGGSLRVTGNTGLLTACEMRGGTLLVQGNVGDFLAGARVGYKNGMQGGVVIVHGSVGDRAGDHMRRGLVLVEGNAGAYCGTRMVSGTIAVLGQVGPHLGYGMKRGTLLLWQDPGASLGPNFNDAGFHTLGFLPLLMRAFQGLDSRFAQVPVFNRVRRFVGDLGGIGQGEILIRADAITRF